MWDLQKVSIQCMDELDILGIEYGNILSFEINTRARKRWGQCKVVPGGYSINISNRLLDDYIPLESLKNTIIHEILHTCRGCMNHGENWQLYAERVNNAYGYNIKRCSSAEEKGVKVSVEPVKLIKHQFVCTGCGQTVNRTKESKFVRLYKDYRCGICGGKFDKLF